MLSSDVKWKATSIGIFVMPLVLVKLIAIVLDAPMTANATASVDVALPDIELVDGMGWKPDWTTRQNKAAAHVEALDAAETFAASPLFYQQLDDDPEVEVQPEEIGVPTFRIGAILRSTRGDVALINGRPYREGDSVSSTGWVVKHIDGTQRTVVLEDPATGRTVTRYVLRLDDNRLQPTSRPQG